MALERAARIKHPDPTYPPDHKPAMQVPKGGSSCLSCEYHVPEKNHCSNRFYIKWNGSPKIPLPPDQYCSDWFEQKA
jgi:hypothetical protein